jgi:hypothetical protein
MGFHEIVFRPAIYYIAITPTIQEFETKKVLGQQQKHIQNKRNKDNNECMKRQRPATAAPFDFSYHAPSTPKHPEPSSTFKKRSTVNTALLPGPNGPRVTPDSE